MTGCDTKDVAHPRSAQRSGMMTLSAESRNYGGLRCRSARAHVTEEEIERPSTPALCRAERLHQPLLSAMPIAILPQESAARNFSLFRHGMVARCRWPLFLLGVLLIQALQIIYAHCVGTVERWQ